MALTHHNTFDASTLDPDNLNDAQRYIAKRGLNRGTTSTGRKIEKAMRIMYGLRKSPERKAFEAAEAAKARAIGLHGIEEANRLTNLRVNTGRSGPRRLKSKGSAI